MADKLYIVHSLVDHYLQMDHMLRQFLNMIQVLQVIIVMDTGWLRLLPITLAV